YFATAHAERLKDRHEFHVFTLVAQIEDPSVTVPITDFVPAPGLGFRRREPLWAGHHPPALRHLVPAGGQGISRLRSAVDHHHARLRSGGPGESGGHD